MHCWVLQPWEPNCHVWYTWYMNSFRPCDCMQWLYPHDVHDLQPYACSVSFVSFRLSVYRNPGWLTGMFINCAAVLFQRRVFMPLVKTGSAPVVTTSVHAWPAQGSESWYTTCNSRSLTCSASRRLQSRVFTDNAAAGGKRDSPKALSIPGSCARWSTLYTEPICQK